MAIPRDGGEILYSFVGDLILGHLRTVNGELCGSYRENISF